MPSSIAVILNSRAGATTGRPAIAAEVADLFRAAGCEAEILALGHNPTGAARHASARASIVVAGGGDGTVSSVAAGIFESPAALGILPLGTRNHFAKDLGIPVDLRKAVAVIAAGHIAHVDVGQVNDRIFLNNSSIGVYPSIVDAREELRRQGRRNWVATAIATVRVLRRYRGMTVRIDVDGQRRVWRTPFVFVGNNEYAIDGIRIGGRARLDQGRVYVYLAPRVRAHELPLLFAKALIGRARQSDGFEIVPATELWIDPAGSRSQRMRVALDGEVSRMRTPLHYRTHPKALPVVLPER